MQAISIDTGGMTREAASAARLDVHLRAASSGVPPADDAGNIPPGVFRSTWDGFADRFGGTPRRDALVGHLQVASRDLARAGIRDVIVGGSFVSSKPDPGDVDVAWVPNGHPMHRRFITGLADHVGRVAPGIDLHRADAVPADAPAYGHPVGTSFAELFSVGRDGARHGVVLLSTTPPGAPDVGVDPAFMRAVRGLSRMVG